jgi:outer membrane protein assembly factor BamA
MKKLLLILFIFNGTLSFSQDSTEYIYIRNESNTLKSSLDDEEYFPVAINEIENFLKNQITHYENFGYPFAEVKLDNIIDNKADIIINRGELYTIDSLIIYGDSKLSQNQLYNIIGLKKGGIYNQSKLDRIENILEKSGNHNQTKPFEFVFHKNTFDIYFYLEKSSSNSIDALIGINSNNKELNVSGHLNLDLQNILNKEEKISVKWISEQEKFQKIEGSIYIPFAFKGRYLTNLNFDVYNKYNEFSNTKTQFSVLSNTLGINNFGFSYTHQKSSPENIEISNSKTETVGIKHIFSNSKHKLNYSANFGNRKQETSITIYSNFHFKYSYQHSFSKQFSLEFSTLNKLILSEELEENELLFFGGTNTIKGYFEDELKSSFYNIITINPRFQLDKSIDANLFLQKAIYKDIYNSEELIYPTSFGIGIDLKNKNNIIYIQYAIAFSENRAFSIENGKIHIGLKNTF